MVCSVHIAVHGGEQVFSDTVSQDKTPPNNIRVGETIWGSILNFSFGGFRLDSSVFGPSGIERELPMLSEFAGTSTIKSCKQSSNGKHSGIERKLAQICQLINPRRPQRRFSLRYSTWSPDCEDCGGEPEPGREGFGERDGEPPQPQ